jgi:hypothetical protein
MRRNYTDAKKKILISQPHGKRRRHPDSFCLSVFDWVHYRRSKGANMLHMLLAHQGYLPKWAMVTAGKTHEVKVLKTLDVKTIRL